MLTGLLYTGVRFAAAQPRLHTDYREKLTVFAFFTLFQGRTAVLRGFPVHSCPRDEEPVQLLLFTFLGLDVHTSDVSGKAGVQLDPLAVHQLLLQGRHQQEQRFSFLLILSKRVDC